MASNADKVVVRAQAAHLKLMVDACTITRKVSEVTDSDTGVVTPTYTTIYTGVCRVKQRSQTGVVGGRPKDVGEAYNLLLAIELQLPNSVPTINAEDRVTITASVHDPDLVGRVFHIRGLSHRTHGSAKRYPCFEITS
jgi:hypothetical protein